MLIGDHGWLAQRAKQFFWQAGRAQLTPGGRVGQARTTASEWSIRASGTASRVKYAHWCAYFHRKCSRIMRRPSASESGRASVVCTTAANRGEPYPSPPNTSRGATPARGFRNPFGGPSERGRYCAKVNSPIAEVTAAPGAIPLRTVCERRSAAPTVPGAPSMERMREGEDRRVDADAQCLTSD